MCWRLSCKRIFALFAPLRLIFFNHKGTKGTKWAQKKKSVELRGDKTLFPPYFPEQNNLSSQWQPQTTTLLK
jgi:hypothetical protein